MNQILRFTDVWGEEGKKKKTFRIRFANTFVVVAGGSGNKDSNAKVSDIHGWRHHI